MAGPLAARAIAVRQPGLATKAICAAAARNLPSPKRSSVLTRTLPEPVDAIAEATNPAV